MGSEVHSRRFLSQLLLRTFSKSDRVILVVDQSWDKSNSSRHHYCA
jgi:hypothetical protein